MSRSFPQLLMMRMYLKDTKVIKKFLLEMEKQIFLKIIWSFGLVFQI